MLKEGELKESRGWLYKELEFDIKTECKLEENKKIEDIEVVEGVQVGMFE